MKHKTIDQQPKTGEWRHGLFSCCGSCSDCCCAMLCPPCYGYTVSRAAGEDKLMSCCTCLTYPCCLCCLRSSVRSQRGIDGSCVGDFLCIWCCTCCTAIQMKREFN